MNTHSEVGGAIESIKSQIAPEKITQAKVESIKKLLGPTNNPTQIGKLLNWYNANNIFGPLFTGNTNAIANSKEHILRSLTAIKNKLPTMHMQLRNFTNGNLKNKYKNLDWKQVEKPNFLDNYGGMLALKDQMIQQINTASRANGAKEIANKYLAEAEQQQIIANLIKDISYNILTFGVLGYAAKGLTTLSTMPQIKAAAIIIASTRPDKATQAALLALKVGPATLNTLRGMSGVGDILALLEGIGYKRSA